MKVKLGKNASVFHDPYSGITVKPGKVVEITAIQARTSRIKAALNGGCLVITTEDTAAKSVIPKNPVSTPEELKKSFDSMVEAEATSEDLLKAFSKKEFKDIAEQYEIEVEKEDTKETILSAILEAFDEAKNVEE